MLTPRSDATIAAEAQLAEADLDISNLTYAAVTGAEKLEFPERS